MNKKEVKINSQGSLGILALGSEGIRIWRAAIKEEKEKSSSKKKNDKKA